MTRMLPAALALAASLGTAGLGIAGLATAQAQALDAASRARAAHAGGAPGTVGAMEAVVQGLATSPDDVAAQQEGRSTAAEGGRTLEDRPAPSAAAGYAPGTVGATPGNDRAR